MKTKHFQLLHLLLLGSLMINAQTSQDLKIKSPDGNIIVQIDAGEKLQWSVRHKGQQILAPSSISLQLEGGETLGEYATIQSSEREEIHREITAINYKKAIIPDHCNQLTIQCKNDYGVIFRAYNDAVAYRFFIRKNDSIVIRNEEANFNFTVDYKAFIPYMRDYRDGRIFNCSFESLYTEQNISQFRSDSLAFLPLLVDAGNGKKVVILEADLEEYPGMFLNINQTGKGFMGVYAPSPLEEMPVRRNLIPTKRAGYIARTSGTWSFPWRVIVISEQDKELLNNDIVQKLASPPRLDDVSWIEPGQAAWEWWNAIGISHVDFRAGMNTATYKYYIDFAAANNIRYVIIDEGWTAGFDLTRVSPRIDLQKLIAHGNRKGVGIILWALWYPLIQQMDTVFALYSEMGIKGFKIDFIDRDDQKAVASTYQMARKAAEHQLIVDLHGIFKPTGLQRTYPNVLGYEGVKGMENVKWANEDVPRYDVTIPFIRMMAGPMDYTPGAMRNTSRQNFRPIFSEPMSQGTRCHQLAMYVVYEVPLQILADNPTIYIKEQECTDFITSVPTTFDETVPLDGKVGEYVAIARRKGDTWYVGAMSNWTARDLTLDFSFLGDGVYNAIVFKDGVNADRIATDYKREEIKVSSGDALTIQLSNGGGWAARIMKAK